ncbi:MAG: hypothetical protein KDB14_11580 [Planctomycetales bacterium]|nr:hypothetical protein [Planctomycetales bacterium]
MSDANLKQRQLVCPNCQRQVIVESPRCRCFHCFHRWDIEWESTPERFWSFNATPKAQRAIAKLAAEVGVDAKALNILFNTQWDLDGREGRWIAYNPPPPEDLAHAEATGLMRPSYELSHAQLVTATQKARAAVDRRDVAAAFLASLPLKRKDLRSALGSYAHALHLPTHRFRKAKGASDDGDNGDGNDDASCEICGADQRESIQPKHCTFRRLMWAGNVLQGDLGYVLCDLQSFCPGEVTCGRDERALLQKIVKAIDKLPDDAGLSQLLGAISALVPGNKHERQVVLEILGSCGILKPADCQGLHEAWVPPKDRPVPESFGRREWRSPVNCWHGRDGVNHEAVEFWFGDV